MIEFWLSYLPIVTYFLVIALLIVLIILGIKSIGVLNKVEKIVDDVNEKMEMIDPIFRVLDLATDRFSSMSSIVIDVITKTLGKLINRKGEK
ncbi:MAG: hypothetical protein R3Y13_01230 [bacterium]